jgi:hypothetical protein
MAIDSEAGKDDKFESLFQGFPVAFVGVEPIHPGFPVRQFILNLQIPWDR